MQGLAPRRVEEPDIGELEGRHQAGQETGAPAVARDRRPGADGADFDGYPHSPGGPAFQLRAPVVDSRHNPQMQGADSERKQAPGGQHHPQQKPRGH
ncbi:hypothetical protein D9M68_607420 [compost metagenome]